MTWLEWITLAGLCWAGAASPGPSLAVVLSACRQGGRSAGLLAAWAHAVGVGLYAGLTVLGFSALLARLPALFIVIQLAGATYLLWMAAKLWFAAATTKEDEEDTGASMTAMRDGFAVAFLNPKLAVFMLALFSQFVQPGAPLDVNAQLVGTAFAVDGIWYSLIALLFTRDGWLAALKRNAQRVDRAFAIALAALALYIASQAIISLNS
ncbi:MAG: LysE family translocator [Pseudomonadota bacterium]